MRVYDVLATDYKLTPAYAVPGRRYLIQAIKVCNEDRQQRIEQETRKVQDAIEFQCRLLFPSDLNVQTQRHLRSMARSDL